MSSAAAVKSSPSSDGISTVGVVSGGSDWSRVKRMKMPTPRAISSAMIVSTYDGCMRASGRAATYLAVSSGGTVAGGGACCITLVAASTTV